MFCYKCGNEIADVSSYCKHCGTKQALDSGEESSIPQPTVFRSKHAEFTAKKNQSKWKYYAVGAGIMAALLIGILIFMYITGTIQFVPLKNIFNFSSSKTKFEGPGFDTPREAAIAYVEALKSMDIRQLWSVFAIESYVEHCDFEAYITHIKYYPPNAMIATPPSNEFSYNVLVMARLSEAYFFRGAFIELTNGLPISFTPENSMMKTDSFENIPSGLSLQQFAEFLEDYTGEKQRQLQNTTVIDIILPENLSVFAKKYGLSDYNKTYTSESNQRILEQMKRIYGADELVDVIIILDVDQEEYVLMPNIVRYGNKWFIFNTGGNLATLCNISWNSMQSLIPLSELNIH